MITPGAVMHDINKTTLVYNIKTSTACKQDIKCLTSSEHCFMSWKMEGLIYVFKAL